MKRRFLHTAWLAAVLALSAAPNAFALTLEQAARQAARQHDAKVLSARTVTRGGQRIHEIKLLTKKGVVKTVNIPDPDSGGKKDRGR